MFHMPCFTDCAETTCLVIMYSVGLVLKCVPAEYETGMVMKVYACRSCLLSSS